MEENTKDFVKGFLKEIQEQYKGFTLQEILTDLKKQKIEQNTEITKEEKKELEKLL